MRPTEGLFFGDLTALWQYHSAHHNRRHCPCARKPMHRHQPGAGKKPKKAKDKIAGPSGIGHNFGGIQPGLLFQKAFQHKDRVPQRPRYYDAMKAGILIGHKVVPGDPPVKAKVFSVRSGIECSDRCNKAHSICRWPLRHHPRPAPVAMLPENQPAGHSHW